MKRLLLVAMCLFGAACGTSAPTITSTAPPTSQLLDDSQAISAAFETFSKAALARDGATAASLLSSSTFSTYDEIRKVALTGTEQQVATLVPSGQIFTYTMRGDLDPAVLRTASPHDLVKAALDRGLVSEDTISAITLGGLTVNDGKALGKVRVARAQTTVFLSFLREDGAWKVELPSLFDFTNATLGATAKEKNLTHVQVIDEMLIAKYGPEKAAEVRKPIGA
ncbi:hypothetical protein [Lentzea sp. NPDC051838]|uniref:hypothetical protein n=1 Tax=Lentzea sp. NPDC051838 TaxID=3154849 RepID=UPI00343D61E9